VLRRVRLHWRHYLTGALAAAGTSAAAMADPLLLQSLTDHAIAQRSGSLLLAGAAGLFAAAALRQGLNAVSTRASFRAAPGFSLRLRRHTFRHSGLLGAAYHARVTPGHNQFLVERDGERLTDSLHRGMSQVIVWITSIGFATMAVFHFEWRLLLAAIPLHLALLALKHRYGPELNEAAAAAQSTAASASATLQDHLNAITQLQLLPGAILAGACRGFGIGHL
jgi:ABC-type multidrug transport system fused ATPase/permease subunit